MIKILSIFNSQMCREGSVDKQIKKPATKVQVVRKNHNITDAVSRMKPRKGLYQKTVRFAIKYLFL